MSLSINCPLCKNLNSTITVVTKHVYGREGSAFYLCNSCEVIFQYPMLSEKDEKIFYKKEFENFMQKRTGKKNSWTKIDEHLKINEDNKQRRYNYLKKFKIKLFPNIKKLIKQKASYDIIMHFFVLEHIRNPKDFLLDQLSLLKKNGKIVFEIPCYQDALHKIYDIPEFERFYWSVAHPWYFNENSLKFLLKKLKKKFKIIRDQRYDLSNHLFWMKNGKPGGMKYYSKFLGESIEEKYKKNLISKGYFDTLVGIIYN